LQGQKRKLSDEEKGEIKYQKEEEAAIKKEKKESTENPSINETTKLINTPMSTNSDNDRDKEEEEEEEEDPKDDEKKKNKYNYSFFHLTFAMVSIAFECSSCYPHGMVINCLYLRYEGEYVFGTGSD